MDLQPPAVGTFQFGMFELDAKSGDLRRHGQKVRLPHQSFRILLLLLSRPGDVVTRDELRQALWKGDTFVDFDVGLNSAVRKLREALDDSADSPRFVETLPRRGYRFVATVTVPEQVQPPIHPSSVPPVERSRRPLWIASGLILSVLVAVGTVYGRRASGIDSLAILPFDNLTGDPAQGYFVDAVTDALTTHLAQVRGLDVTARTSARQSKQQQKSIPAIARELDVDAVLEGSVVRAGDRVRISAQLVHAETARHIWARTYDEEIRRILTLQQRIASDVAVVLGRASATGPAGTGATRAVAPEAYDIYLKGLTARGLQRFDGYRTAVGYFEQAIARQPDFAEAHAALAQSQLQFLFGGPISPREAMPKAEAAARRAIELDAALPQAHRTLGQILSLFHWNWKEAEEEFHRAAKLSPDADASPTVSMVRNGRFAQAIAEAEQWRRRDPLSFAAQVNVGLAYRGAGQHDRALAELRRALEITPGQSRAMFQLGITYVLMGRFDDAVREFEAALQASQGRNPRMDAYRGYAYARAGRPLDARRVLADLDARRAEQYVSSFGIALIHDVLGEKAEALQAIERACDDRAVEFAQMRQYPAFTTIASEPRFLAVMQRVNLPR